MAGRGRSNGPIAKAPRGRGGQAVGAGTVSNDQCEPIGAVVERWLKEHIANGLRLHGRGREQSPTEQA